MASVNNDSNMCDMDSMPYLNYIELLAYRDTTGNNQFVLNDADKNILNQCKYFTDTLQCILSDIEKQGHTEKIPAFPKSELLRIMCVKKQKGF